MQLRETMARLEKLGTEQNRKIYRRHGATGDLFGVSFGNLRALAKEIKRDHALAQQLWRTKNADARVLATLIADPEATTSQELDAWLADVSYYVVADALVGFVSVSPLARAKADAWRSSKQEWTGRAGWNLVAHLALRDSDVPNDYFEGRLEEIHERIHRMPNRMRDAMNNAMIAIGGRNVHLRARAIATARAVGKVEVDHGETGCKTPDAEPYILKMAARVASKRVTPERAGKRRATGHATARKTSRSSRKP